jgi:uncharacterized membrane protein
MVMECANVNSSIEHGGNSITVLFQTACVFFIIAIILHAVILIIYFSVLRKTICMIWLIKAEQIAETTEELRMEIISMVDMLNLLLCLHLLELSQ